MITLHEAVPSFSAQATDGQHIDLSALKGKNIVLYFYPKDNTPGCILEGRQFRDLYDEFQRHETEIIGVSRDSLASHEKFKCLYTFPFPLVSDKEEQLCTLFDVIKEKSMFGKKIRGIQRSTFLINKEGILVAEWRKVSVLGHAKKVLDTLIAQKNG